MPVAPTLKIYKVTGSGTGSISQFNTGGITAVHVGSGAPSPYDVADWGNIQAGQWSANPDNPPPLCFIWEWTNNTADSINFGLYDHVADNTGEDFFDGDASDQYTFRIKLSKTYVNPLTFTAAAIESGSSQGWENFPHGGSNVVLDTLFASELGSVGNDDTANLLVGHNSNAGTIASPQAGDRFYTNFFTYLAMKPGSTSEPGEHLNWGPRTSYVYPTA